MPGTIQVSVLEFKGPSSSQSNLTSLKVSMGKRVFRTSEAGDFSFPLTTLRDDLVVTLVDTEENEIANTGIQTMAIIEKGFWDESFSLEGGGHVHMKLRFDLSEEDRSRIRVVRESVMKKKHVTHPSINHRHSEISVSTNDPDTVETSMPNETEVADFEPRSTKIEVIGHEVVGPQAGSLGKSTASSVHPQSDFQDREGSTFESTPNQSEGASSSPVRHGLKSQFPQVDQRQPVEKLETHISLASICSKPAVKREILSKSKSATEISSISKMQDDRLEKTPSSVRKMISAFESNLVQDLKSPRKAPLVQSQLNRSGKEGSSKDQDSKVDMSRIAREELTVEEQKKSRIDIIRPSTSGTSATSGRMHEEKSRGVQVCNFSVEPLGSLNSSAVDGGDARPELESSTKLNTQVASNRKTKQLEYYEEEYYSSESSGMWIFPDNTRRLCITTAGSKVMKALGRHCVESRNQQEKKYLSIPHMTEKCNLPFRNEHEIRKEDKISSNQQDSGRGSTPDDASGGLVGQVLKIVIILGFGAFVFLTRQKEPRKRERDENTLPRSKPH